jgi:hypothetical protein
MEFKFGWLVEPDMEAIAQSATSTPASAALKIEAALIPLVSCVPRILRPRKKFGTVYGFSVVDVGGNWLRISKIGDKEPEANEEKATGLAGFLNVAARLGDAHGDEALALKTIENGLKKFPDAPTLDRARAYLYRAELALRLKNKALALTSLAAAEALELSEQERNNLAEEWARTTELAQELAQ